MQRFYHLDIRLDLLGNHCLVREWGRIGRPGQIRSVPYPTENEAQIAFQKQRAAKERRGYAASALQFSVAINLCDAMAV